MPFVKGYSGNLNGRPPGIPNKASRQLRNAISDFLEQKFDQVIEDFEQLEPKDRIKVFTDLLQYSVPKMQAVSNSFEFENLTHQPPFTDEQVVKIITEMKEKLS